ncbi:Uncharacterised protein [Klebsiella pneumoniae]|nr:Uncharacterised protein [Klebsiella pneumoniae]VGP66719.1 hypothetical protein SB00610_03251 [Klebsiella quasipneumoniae subsp. similipneumoniae]SLS64410.1 Uncharacterised protein [Klebsiella pneumoniae]SLV38196.1 Uncharacterised protein [Klebsiella pneumoniae]SLX01182.1 Uncharacterised protein [Klebsiella pneumoniae]
MGTDFILQHFGNLAQMINPRLSGVAPHFARRNILTGMFRVIPGKHGSCAYFVNRVEFVAGIFLINILRG